MFFDVTVSKFTAQAIHGAHELDGHPLHPLISSSSSFAGTSRSERKGREIDYPPARTSAWREVRLSHDFAIWCAML
jgi:hypothetical protein